MPDENFTDSRLMLSAATGDIARDDAYSLLFVSRGLAMTMRDFFARFSHSYEVLHIASSRASPRPPPPGVAAAVKSSTSFIIAEFE